MSANAYSKPPPIDKDAFTKETSESIFKSSKELTVPLRATSSVALALVLIDAHLIYLYY